MWNCSKCGSSKKAQYKLLCGRCYGQQQRANPVFRKDQSEKKRIYREKHKQEIIGYKQKYRLKPENASRMGRYATDYTKKRYHSDDEFKRLFSIRAKTRHTFSKSGECDFCKDKTRTEFHHISYEPIRVIELCKRCHLRLHGRDFYGK